MVRSKRIIILSEWIIFSDVLLHGLAKSKIIQSATQFFKETFDTVLIAFADEQPIWLECLNCENYQPSICLPLSAEPGALQS